MNDEAYYHGLTADSPDNPYYEGTYEWHEFNEGYNDRPLANVPPSVDKAFILLICVLVVVCAINSLT